MRSKISKAKRLAFLSVCVVLLVNLGSCASQPPASPNNLCAIYDEYPKWRKAARKAERKWGVPQWLAMSFVYQESAFVHDAKPPRRKLLGVVPWRRPTSAYGYAQATNEAWEDYLDDAGGWFADRDDFSDALDFIGWYNHRSHKRLGIAKDNARQLYLAYYLGHGGYARQRWNKLPESVGYADRVARRAWRYREQMRSC